METQTDVGQGGSGGGGGGSKKREHPAEDLPYAPQTKIRVNDRYMDERDETRMQEIHKKTQQMLFQGSSRSANGVNSDELPSVSRPSTSQAENFTIMGNGELLLRSFTKNDTLTEMSRKEAKCCSRKSYISTDCIDCSMPLCEFCGYSCVECFSFLCTSCVALFGYGSQERPICEKCAMFNSRAQKDLENK